MRTLLFLSAALLSAAPALAVTNITVIVPAKKAPLDSLSAAFLHLTSGSTSTGSTSTSTSTSTSSIGELLKGMKTPINTEAGPVAVRVVDAGWGGLFAAIEEAATSGGFVSVDPSSGRYVAPPPSSSSAFGEIVDREKEAREKGYERVKVDIAWVGSTWFGSLQNNYRVFHPLDAYFSDWAAQRPGGRVSVDFAAGLDFDYRMSIAGESAQWYGLPLDVGARLYFYRKDMFREALGSDEPPATLAELESKGRRVRDHYASLGRNVSGAGVSTVLVDGNTIQDFSTWFIGHGGAMSASDGSCGYVTPEFRAAFDQHARIYSGADPLDLKVNSTMFTLMDDFLNGELAQGIFGSWAFWSFYGQRPEFAEDVFLDNVGIMAPPAGPARRATFFGSSAWTILESSDRKDAAFEFLKFIMEPGTPQHTLFIGEDIPSYTSLLDVARFVDASIPALATVQALPFAYPQTFPDKDYAKLAGDIEASDVIQRMVSDVHLGVKTTAEAIEWGCVRTAEVLAEADRIRAERFPAPAGGGTIVVGGGASDSMPLIVSLSSAAGAILLILAAVFLWRRRSRAAHRSLVQQYQGHKDELEREKAAATIPFADIQFGSKIGAGAFGDVFRGDLHGTPVAIKKLRVTDAGVADELRTEAAVIARLRHPNVCLFMGTSTDPSDGSLCLVTEFLEHGSVYDMIHNSDVAMDLSLVASFLKGAALGCAYLHAREPPLLHKDIKSLNILADGNLVPKICDFGLSDQTKGGGVVSSADLARAGRSGVKLPSGGAYKSSLLKRTSTDRSSAHSLASLTPSPQTASLVSAYAQSNFSNASINGNGTLPPGSLYWMAPEVARGEPYTKAADVYSFGITMWELITREDPYGGDPPFAVIQQVLNHNRRPEIPPTVPRQLAELIRSCWAEDPRSRPSFKEIVQNLNSIFGGTSGTVHNSSSAASAPTGEVTLVFTDVKGSTELWEAHPAEMRVSLGLHNACARSLIREHGGYEVKTEGDAFMVAFAKPVSAVRWACALEEQLVQLDWPAGILAHEHCAVTKIGSSTLYAGLRVRIGMHTAKVQAQLDASTRRMDYFGRGVNKSARVSGKAQGGQVIVTEDTLAAAGGEDALTALGLVVADLGPVYLKGIEEPANMFQVLPTSLQGRTFKTVGAASTAGAFSPLRRTNSASSDTPGSPAAGDDDAQVGFTFDGVLGRVQALVKKQAWSIDYADLTVGSMVGFGTFGQVFDSVYRGQRVAVKKLLAHNLSEAHMLRFFEEMSILSNMRHPNIVMFVGATVDPPSIITEFASRGTLEDALASNKKTRALSLQTKVSIAQQVASAMIYLASAKPPLLHRDLKSANVLLAENNVAKVADFGLTTARRASSTMSSVGTPGFMAPEVLAGNDYSSSADVFAFGMLLYEIITELPPFQGLPSIKVGQLVLRGDRAKLPLSIESKPELKGLVALMKNCWHQDPAARPTFEDIVDRLNSAIIQG